MRAYAPGRVNLIGDHTDYSGGLVLPMAIDRGTTVAGEVGGEVVRLRSGAEPDEAVVPIDVRDPSGVEPAWARYVAGVVSGVRPRIGLAGDVTTTLPVGAGLSSSAALEVAVALALGFEGTPLELALACQRAEEIASGVPCGVMDPLASAAGVAGHALLIDCASLSVAPLRLPDEIEVVVVDSGERRALASSAYAERRSQCEAAAHAMGRPLRGASLTDAKAVVEPVLRSRASHVITENARVAGFAAALSAGDLTAAGAAMAASHASLRDDFAVSTPTLDALIEHLDDVPGVLGARMTGAGFGGCAVALVESGTALGDLGGVEAWPVRAADGARVS